VETRSFSLHGDVETAVGAPVPGCAETCPRTGQGSTAGRPGTLARRLYKYAHLSLLDDPSVIIDWSRRWEWPVLGQVLGGALFDELFPDPREPFPEVRAIIGCGHGGGFSEHRAAFTCS